jgi:sugar phosphate permease
MNYKSRCALAAACVSFVFTLMVVYILINWLPSLVVGQDFTGKQASWVMFALQIGAAVGTLLLGVGSAVAVGRLGAMSAPLVAGQMLALGTGTAGVMLASAPGIVIAALAMFGLSVRRKKLLPD